MIAKYVRERGYEGRGKDPYLSLEKEYLIVGINFWSENNYTPEISVLSDRDQTPVLIELKFFDIIDGRIPKEWFLFNLSNGWKRLTPQEFGGDFWEEFHDGNPEAEAIFDDVMKRLHEFHGWPYTPREKELEYF